MIELTDADRAAINAERVRVFVDLPAWERRYVNWDETLYRAGLAAGRAREIEEVDLLRAQVKYWRITAAHRGQQILNAAPVAWMRDDGTEGSISTMTVCISDKVRDLWLKANPTQVERYTIPLYAALNAPAAP